MALAAAGATVLMRTLLHSATIAAEARTQFIATVVELGVLLVVSLVLAGIAWWLVLRLHDSHRQLQDLAIRDPLTGLYNRRYFREVYATEVGRAQRSGVPFSVAMVDIDGFKQLNDTKGHLAGDAVLVSFAELLRASLRSVDILARYGGDEFVVLMPMTTADNAKAALNRLTRNLAHWRPKEAPHGLRVSIGVSTWDGGAEVLEQADRMMYQVKRVQSGVAG